MYTPSLSEIQELAKRGGANLAAGYRDVGAGPERRGAGLPGFTGGAVAFLSHEAVRHFEPRVPMATADPQGLPEALFMFVDTLLVFDHLKHTIKVVAPCRLDGDGG